MIDYAIYIVFLTDALSYVDYREWIGFISCTNVNWLAIATWNTVLKRIFV